MLDEIPEDLVTQLSRYARDKQKEKAPFVRGGQLIAKAMKKWKPWLDLQDLPDPFVRRNKPWHVKQNFLPLPKFEKGLRKLPSGDDLFTMDYADVASPSTTTDTPQQFDGGSNVVSGWKVYVPPKCVFVSLSLSKLYSQISSGLI